MSDKPEVEQAAEADKARAVAEWDEFVRNLVSDLEKRMRRLFEGPMLGEVEVLQLANFIGAMTAGRYQVRVKIAKIVVRETKK